MDGHMPWELDTTGSTGIDEAWSGGTATDPLQEACGDLNFANSLLRDAHRLRARVLDVLVDVSLGREQAAARLDRIARDLGPGAAQDRLRSAAARARANLDATERRWRRLAAMEIEEPFLPGR
ncbi:hypothetical protein [Actinomycetospora succinea]|nr:hypothetical protein [Actinomycetospora succinea]